jgi:hypothetical protein
MKQELSLVAIDLAKKIFHLVGADTTGKILWRKRLTRHASEGHSSHTLCSARAACGEHTPFLTGQSITFQPVWRAAGLHGPMIKALREIVCRKQSDDGPAPLEGSGADNPASRNLSRRLYLWTRGSVVPDKTEKALLSASIFALRLPTGALTTPPCRSRQHTTLSAIMFLTRYYLE